MEKQRTKKQNRALHKFFELLSDELNDAGLDMRKVLKPSVEIPWTTYSIKKQLWKPFMQAMYGKNSTKKLLKQREIDRIHEVLMKHLGEKFSVEYIPFPSIENFIENYEEYATHKPIGVSGSDAHSWAETGIRTSSAGTQRPLQQPGNRSLPGITHQQRHAQV